MVRSRSRRACEVSGDGRDFDPLDLRPAASLSLGRRPGDGLAEESDRDPSDSDLDAARQIAGNEGPYTTRWRFWGEAASSLGQSSSFRALDRSAGADMPGLPRDVLESCGSARAESDVSRTTRATSQGSSAPSSGDEMSCFESETRALPPRGDRRSDRRARAYNEDRPHPRPLGCSGEAAERRDGPTACEPPSGGPGPVDAGLRGRGRRRRNCGGSRD
jgi:hypothetical protein